MTFRQLSPTAQAGPACHVLPTAGELTVSLDRHDGNATHGGPPQPTRSDVLSCTRGVGGGHQERFPEEVGQDPNPRRRWLGGDRDSPRLGHNTGLA